MIVSFVAMLLIAASYFVKHKSGFLLFQSAGIVFLMASYLLEGAYFATVGLGIGLARSLIFFGYEKKDKRAPIAWSYLFSALGIAVYFIINVWILKSYVWYDVLYLVGLIFYAFVFRIRNLEWMLYMVTIPTGISILYNVVSKATPFVVISYSFELGANLLAILKYHIFEKKEKDCEED